MMNSLPSILESELNRRSDRNPKYSLRAFARDLNLSPSRLSEIMSGQGTSRVSIRKISSLLGLSKSLEQYYCDEVDANHCRDPRRRELAKTRLEKFKQKSSPYELEETSFRLISEWYHLGILHLAQNPNFKSSSTWIGKKLGISPNTAALAIDRLERAGLIDILDDNSIIVLHKETLTPDGTSPMAMKGFHEQILKKGQEALYSQSSDERWVSTKVLSVPQNAIPEVVAICKEFQEKVEDALSKYTPDSEIYALSTQFFRLSNPENSH